MGVGTVGDSAMISPNEILVEEEVPARFATRKEAEKWATAVAKRAKGWEMCSKFGAIDWIIDRTKFTTPEEYKNNGGKMFRPDNYNPAYDAARFEGRIVERRGCPPGTDWKERLLRVEVIERTP